MCIAPSYCIWQVLLCLMLHAVQSFQGSIIALMSMMLHLTCSTAKLCLSSKPVLPLHAFLPVQRGGEGCQG